MAIIDLLDSGCGISPDGIAFIQNELSFNACALGEGFDGIAGIGHRYELFTRFAEEC